MRDLSFGANSESFKHDETLRSLMERALAPDPNEEEAEEQVGAESGEVATAVFVCRCVGLLLILSLHT